MCRASTYAVTVALTIAVHCSGDVVSPQTEPVTLPRPGVCGLRPRPMSDEHGRGSATELSAAGTVCPAPEQSGDGNYNAGLASCQFVSAVVDLVERYAAYLDASYINFILKGKTNCSFHVLVCTYSSFMYGLVHTCSCACIIVASRTKVRIG